MKSTNLQSKKNAIPYSEILDALSNFILVLDPVNQNIQFANQSFCDFLGYEPDEFKIGTTNKSIQIFYDEDLLNLLKNRNNHFDTSQTNICRCLDKNGKIKKLNCAIKLINSDGSKLLLLDATEAKSNRQQNKTDFHCQNLIGGMLNLFSSIVYQIDVSNKKFVLMNDKLFDILGYTIDEVQPVEGHNFLKYIHPDDRHLMGNLDEYQTHEKNQIYEKQFRAIHKNGSIKTLHSKLIAYECDINNKALHIFGIVKDITKQKNIEAELQKRKNHIQLLTDHLPAVIGHVDENCVYKFVNKSYAEWFNISRDKIIGRKASDILDESAYKRALPNIQKALKGEIVQFNNYIKNYKGEIRTLKTLYVPEKNNENEVVGFFILGIDIMEQEMKTQKIIENEKKYRFLFTNAPIALIDEDYSEVMKYLNQLKTKANNDFADFFDKNPDEIYKCAQLIKINDFNNEYRKLYEMDESQTKQSIIPNLTAKSIADIGKLLTSLANNQVPDELVTEMKTNKNNIKYTHVKFYIDEKPSFNFSSVLLAMHDITEIENLTKRLKINENKLRLSQKLAKQGIYEIDIENDITYIYPPTKEKPSDKWTRFKLSFHESLQRIHQDDIDRINEIVKRFLSPENIIDTFEFECKMLNFENNYFWGYFIFEITERKKDNCPTKILGTYLDITSFKENEAELRIAKEKAQESDRLKTIFLNYVSHEIKTPMNSIFGFSELLKNPDISKIKHDQFLTIVNESAAKLLETIGAIIDISQIELNSVEIDNSSFSVKTSLAEIVDAILFSKAYQEKLYIKVNFNPTDEKDIQIFTDKIKFQKIIRTLLFNALRFTEQGSIEIIFYLPDSSHLRVCVKDTGIGIKKENINIIFEKFRQEDEGMTRKYGGIGLGLSICKGYAELMQGKLWVETQINVGSSFYLDLPLNVAKQSKK